jgi:hypothetical protein
VDPPEGGATEAGRGSLAALPISHLLDFKGIEVGHSCSRPWVQGVVHRDGSLINGRHTSTPLEVSAGVEGLSLRFPGSEGDGLEGLS